MKCPNCGNEVGGRFCTNCGTRMDEAQDAPGSMSVDPSATAVISPADVHSFQANGSADARQATQAGSGVSDPAATNIMRPDELTGVGSGPGTGYGAAAQQPTSGSMGGPAEADVPPPSAQTNTPGGSRWAQQLGVPSTPTSPRSSVNFAGPPVPPAVQDALKPLEQFGRQPVAWAGAVLLLVGLFFSAKTYSISGSILGSSFGASKSYSLWDYATFWSVILVLLAAASAGLAYLRDYKWLWVTGGASFLILLLNFLYAFSNSVNGASVTDVTAHPSWAWILLFPGALLILAAAAMRGREGEPTGDAVAYVSGLMNRS